MDPSSSSSTTVPAQTSDIIPKLRPAKRFANFLEPAHWKPTTFQGFSSVPLVESISFDDTGELCVTAGEDESFVLWDATKGVKKKTFYSRKYGVSHVRFTHGRSNIIHASSRPGENDIRYHSMHDNKYLLYFRGHTARVHSLQMHPTEDSFISAGDDGTVRMYDLRNPKPKALLSEIGASCLAAFDNSGAVFAVASGTHRTVALYATGSGDVKPFHHAQIHDPSLALISTPPRYPTYTSISFSNNGDFILIGTSSSVHYILDAFTLHMHCRLEGHLGLERDQNGNQDVSSRRGGSGEEVCWTADSRWVISGSRDGLVYGWNLSSHPRDPEADGRTVHPDPVTLHPTVKLRNMESATVGGGGGGGVGGVGAPSRAVKLSPRYGVMAVGGDELTFWLPQKETNIEDGY